MHYAITTLLAQPLGLTGSREFMLGGIAPDIHPFMPGVKPKDRTHFVDRNAAGIGRINVERYIAKYRGRLQEPFYLGYLCHLLSDVVWTEMWYSAVEHLPEETRKTWLAACYQDFWRLNARLARHYALERMELGPAIPAIGLEEADYPLRHVPQLLEGLERDFTQSQDAAGEALELFADDNSQIVAYIERCADRCLTVIHERALA